MDSENNHLNLEDIARLSGVSRSTVSRVINDHPNVSQRTRERVMQVIKKYNFQPNAVARALVTQRSRVIGILVPHIITEVFTEPFFAMLIQGITLKANQLDYGVTLGLTSHTDNTNTIHRLINDPLLDGFIVAEASISPEFLAQLHRENKRYVLVGRPPISDLPIHYVDVENEQGGYLMTQYLIQKGYCRIAFMPGRITLTSSIDRQAGYERAMAEAGLPPIITPAGNFTKEGGYLVAKQILSQKVEAIFCASDMMAIGAAEAIKEQGLSIPEDIAIAGFDDASIAANFQPPLTTVRQDVLTSGATAAEILIEHIIENSSDTVIQKILPVSLIVRESA
ncbi:MAG: LacI family transcriptional regulator [Phototrophicales bacterium]|nr:MAG: LacI family transcriptional regulator [Phototrophicales bacterium]